MSRIATAWAWGLNPNSAPAKLILLAMADRADENHECFPSIARLEKDTNLDRKTIMSNLAKLQVAGLIADTGKRKGPTKRVKVYRLIGIELDAREIDVKNSTKNGTIEGVDMAAEPANTDPKEVCNGMVPKTEPFQKRNYPKNGTLNSPKNGTKNQSLNPTTTATSENATFPKFEDLQNQARNSGGGINLHDLDETQIPHWAERAPLFYAIQTNHLEVWRKFVLHNRAECANELMTISKLENRWDKWVSREKQYEHKTNANRNHAQAQRAGHQSESPAERSRRLLREQMESRGIGPEF